MLHQGLHLHAVLHGCKLQGSIPATSPLRQETFHKGVFHPLPRNAAGPYAFDAAPQQHCWISGRTSKMPPWALTTMMHCPWLCWVACRHKAHERMQDLCSA